MKIIRLGRLSNSFGQWQRKSICNASIIMVKYFLKSVKTGICSYLRFIYNFFYLVKLNAKLNVDQARHHRLLFKGYKSTLENIHYLGSNHGDQNALNAFYHDLNSDKHFFLEADIETKMVFFR